MAALTGADRTMEEILAALEDTSGTWSEYDVVNPLTGQTGPKRSWLTTHTSSSSAWATITPDPPEARAAMSCV